MKTARYIKEIGRGAKGARSLGRDQASELFGAMLDGEVSDLELGAILVAMRIKSESLDELLGFADALQARMPAIDMPASAPRCVILPSYNGARRQPNLMPLVALMLARRGVPVLIQGRHDFDARVSPFELLAELGITPMPGLDEARAALTGERPACVRLSLLSPGLDRLLATRVALGVRSAGHTLAKLIDPCPGRSLRVVAVTHPEYLVRMDEYLRASAADAILMRGTEGEIYANPRRRPRIQAYRAGRAEVALEAEAGGSPPQPELPTGTAPDENAEAIRHMLAGKAPIPPPIRAQVALLEEMARNP